MRTFLAVSFAAHALIFYLFWGVSPTAPSPTEIELITIENKNARGGEPGRGRGREKKLKLSPGLSFTPSVEGGDGDKEDSGFATEDWGSGGGRFTELTNYLNYEKLQRQIRGLLNYPSVLGRRGIEGTVNVRLGIKNGQCDWKRTRVSTSSRPFAVYVIALLKKVCTMDAIATVAKAESPAVDLSFHFAMKEAALTDIEHENRDFIVGNVLSFDRTFPKSMLEYQIGPLRGMWFVPALQLDIPWIVEKWDYYVNGADPMAPFKE